MRIRYCMGLVTLVLLVGMSLTLDSGQALILKLSLAQLAAEADTVALGTVTRQTSAWNSQQTAIYTDVTLTVEEVIVGSLGTEVTLRVAGGIVGNIGMRTSNDPVFLTGERVIVFLDTKGGLNRIVGLHQGKYAVQGGMVTSAGQTMAVADFIDAVRATFQTQ